MSFTWAGVLSDLIRGRDLAPDAAGWAMDQILAGDATPVQVAGFAVALRSKGETVAELTGLAQAMLERATPVRLPAEAVDVVGSGGDQAFTVNVSTMAAIVAAACGVPVVKHGNRAASSASGTADCLEALGVAIDVPPAAQAGVLERAGIVFLFAAMYHPSLRFAATARKESSWHEAAAPSSSSSGLGNAASPRKAGSALRMRVSSPHCTSWSRT